MKRGNIFLRIGRFYYEGFRNMTWGWQLWGLILLKLIILFAILRVFFFRPVLAGKTDEERSETVGENLIGQRAAPAEIQIDDLTTTQQHL